MKKLFLILFFLTSCSFVSDDNEIPKDLISEQEMIELRVKLLPVFPFLIIYLNYLLMIYRRLHLIAVSL